MSAGAIVASDNEMHLMSDGVMSYKDDSGDWQVKDRTTNKIKSVNERVALLWLGAGIKQIWEVAKERIKEERLEYPEEIAETVSSTIESFYHDNEINMGARVKITGFNQQDEPEIYTVTSYAGTFDPVKEQLKENQIYVWSMIHGVKGDPFNEYFSKHLESESHRDLKGVSRAAFKSAIRSHNHETIGGSTHYHGLSPHRFLGIIDEAETGVANAGLQTGRDRRLSTYRNSRISSRPHG